MWYLEEGLKHNSGGINTEKHYYQSFSTTHVPYEINFIPNKKAMFLSVICVQWNFILNWIKVTQLAEQIFYAITNVEIFMYSSAVTLIATWLCYRGNHKNEVPL